MNARILAAYRFFRERTGCVGRDAEVALRLARAESLAEERDLVLVTEDDTEEYQLGDCETEPPTYVFCMLVYRASDVVEFTGQPLRHAVPLACLGGIGVLDTRDPYLRHVGAELFCEALDVLDAEDAEEASEMNARATYAQNGATL